MVKILKNQYYAFTLAEVLITLGIIGIVAALTIPNLINNTNQKELTTRLKKTYSALSNATKMIVATTGSLDASSAANVTAQYKSVMNANKDALFNDGINFSPTKYYKYYKNSSAAGYNYTASSNPGFVVLDGVSLMYDMASSTCNATVVGVTNMCGIWYVDVNGAKSPNMWGYDFYQFPLVFRNGEYRVIPFGAGNGDTQTCAANSSTSDTSNGCTAAALTDNLP